MVCSRYVESFQNFEGKRAWPALFEMSVSKQREKTTYVFVYTWNTLRSPQRDVRSTLLSSCYFWISICVDNASLALYFYRNMILIYNRRKPITASSVIVRKISLAVAYTIKYSLWRFVQGMLNLFRILQVSVRDQRSSKCASRSNGRKQRMYVCIYMYVLKHSGQYL